MIRFNQDGLNSEKKRKNTADIFDAKYLFFYCKSDLKHFDYQVKKCLRRKVDIFQSRRSRFEKAYLLDAKSCHLRIESINF